MILALHMLMLFLHWLSTDNSSSCGFLLRLCVSQGTKICVYLHFDPSFLLLPWLWRAMPIAPQDHSQRKLWLEQHSVEKWKLERLKNPCPSLHRCCVFRSANWCSARRLLVEIDFLMLKHAKTTFCVVLSHNMFKITQKITKIMFKKGVYQRFSLRCRPAFGCQPALKSNT